MKRRLAIKHFSAPRFGVLDGFVGNVKRLVPVGILLGQLAAEVSGSGVDVDFTLAEPAFKLGVAGLDVVRGVARPPRSRNRRRPRRSARESW